MKETMKLWELIKWSSEGAYLDGDYFVSEDNDTLTIFAGRIKLESQLKLNSVWEYRGNVL